MAAAMAVENGMEATPTATDLYRARRGTPTTTRCMARAGAMKHPHESVPDGEQTVSTRFCSHSQLTFPTSTSAFFAALAPSSKATAEFRNCCWIASLAALQRGPWISLGGLTLLRDRLAANGHCKHVPPTCLAECAVRWEAEKH